MTTETMLTSFRRSVHTLLRFYEDQKHQDGGGFAGHQKSYHSRSPSFEEQHSGGLSLIAAEVQKPENVVEAFALKLILPANYSPEKPDPYAIHCYNDGSFGLQSCTESLGFESSNELVQSESETIEKDQEEGSGLQNRYRRKTIRKSEMKFPPPLSSMNREGQSCYFLKPVRKDGRFLLTEMKIDRREIFCAWRHDGRLKLRLVKQDQNLYQPDLRNQEEETEQESKESEEEEEKEETMKVSSNEGQREVQWQENTRSFPLKSEGLRRCQEQRNQLSFWNAHCVTTT